MGFGARCAACAALKNLNGNICAIRMHYLCRRNSCRAGGGGRSWSRI